MSERPAEPRVIDPDDPKEVRQVAEALHVRQELVEEAIRKVGPNRTAIELWLAAPRV